VKAGWIVASTVDGAAVVIMHLPAGLEPGGWASPGPKRLDENPKRKPSATSRYATNERAPQRSGSLRNAAASRGKCAFRPAPAGICWCQWG
jgi:hypothetical protein